MLKKFFRKSDQGQPVHPEAGADRHWAGEERDGPGRAEHHRGPDAGENPGGPKIFLISSVFYQRKNSEQ